jgi:hypothetical protein
LTRYIIGIDILMPREYLIVDHGIGSWNGNGKNKEGR